MDLKKQDELDKALKIAQFMKDAQGKLKKVNDYSGIGAAVRTMVDGGKVKLDFPSDDYLTGDNDTDNN